MALIDSIENAQKEICKKYGVPYYPSPSEMKIGIALNVGGNLTPVNGLRHPPQGDTTGWYIWAGEQLSSDADYFKPLHVQHLQSWCPQVQKFLGLPPGWRFLLAGDYEDVWYDESLLNV
ncbi:hypothetical protein CN212_19115 [Sinorhizobium meliloti]|nr:hypothetical protein CN212_19115 [Sinorhizobium meliloti]